MPGPDARFWADRTPSKQRPSFPVYRGHGTADAVVIGGGLTGCVAAHVLAGAGLDVVLLEADRLAGGSTAGSFGAILPEPDALFRTVEAACGRRAARTAWAEAHRAAREFTRALGKLPLKRELSSESFVLNARTPDAAAELKREHAARKTAGIVTPWLASRAAQNELGSESDGAIRMRDAALVDPVRASLALARAAHASGARIFERSPVRRTKYDRKEAEVVLATGTIKTGLVFVATGEPGLLFSQIRRHVWRTTGYAVVTEPLTTEMRRAVGPRKAVVTEPGADARWLRWLPDHRALFAGAAGKTPASRLLDKVITQRTDELMYEFSVRFPVISGLPVARRWHMPICTTQDGLPWIGAHRNYPFHFFAMAFGWHGDALAWWAARAALRSAKLQPRREDDVFGFARM
jgi:glycine/D-amino acid oxidase-like deaminating enzyme